MPAAVHVQRQVAVAIIVAVEEAAYQKPRDPDRPLVCMRPCSSTSSWRRAGRPLKQIILDLDATDDRLHGHQEGFQHIFHRGDEAGVGGDGGHPLPIAVRFEGTVLIFVWGLGTMGR